MIETDIITLRTHILITQAHSLAANDGESCITMLCRKRVLFVSEARHFPMAFLDVVNASLVRHCTGRSQMVSTVSSSKEVRKASAPFGRGVLYRASAYITNPGMILQLVSSAVVGWTNPSRTSTPQKAKAAILSPLPPPRAVMGLRTAIIRVE